MQLQEEVASLPMEATGLPVHSMAEAVEEPKLVVGADLSKSSCPGHACVSLIAAWDW